MCLNLRAGLTALIFMALAVVGSAAPLSSRPVVAKRYFTAAPVPADRAKAEKERLALEAKLHGSWRAGPCEGQLTFRPDGTYDWKFRGPGGDADSGTWMVRLDPEEPVLVLKCRESDDSERESKTVELKLALSENGFKLRPVEGKPYDFERLMKEPQRP